MKIKLLKDHQGVETSGRFYRTGTEIDVPDEYALKMVEFGWAIAARSTKIAQPPKRTTQRKTVKQDDKA